MTPVNAILALIVRLWAAGVLLSSTITVLHFPVFFGAEWAALNSYDIRNFTSTVFMFFVGVAVWIFAPRIAKSVHVSDHDDGIRMDVSADTLIMIGSFLIGLFYLVQHVPVLLLDIGYMSVDIIQHDSSITSARTDLQLERWNVERALRGAGIIFVASWMAFRPSHLARVFSWLRSAGQYDHSRDKLEKDQETSQ